MLSTNAMLFVCCLSGCCAVSLPPKTTYIRFTSSCFNLCLPFIVVTKISCQKASCLWQPTVATARSHLAWRQERKHFRHECPESFLEAPIVSLFHSLFLNAKSSFLFITLSLPTAKLHQQFVQKTLFIYREQGPERWRVSFSEGQARRGWHWLTASVQWLHFHAVDQCHALRMLLVWLLRSFTPTQNHLYPFHVFLF